MERVQARLVGGNDFLLSCMLWSNYRLQSCSILRLAIQLVLWLVLVQ